MRVLSVFAPPLCTACRMPCPDAAVLCGSCRHALDYLGPAPAALGGVTVWAPLAYEGPARAVVRGLKFHGATALADHMAAAIVANAPAGLLEHPLVPVPSPAARRRRRGFCHALLLAQALAARTGLPVRGLLERTGDTRRQVGRARSQRVRRPPRFSALAAADGPAVLVDDVVTTGATLGACAHALREVGCSCERAVAYARTPVR
jgi:predicted amidophosphoribosyltransferase